MMIQRWERLLCKLLSDLERYRAEEEGCHTDSRYTGTQPCLSDQVSMTTWKRMGERIMLIILEVRISDPFGRKDMC